MKNAKFLLLFAPVLAVCCQTDPNAPANKPNTPTVSVDENSVTRVSMLVTGAFTGNLTDVTSYGVEYSETLFESGKEYNTLSPVEIEEGNYSLGVTNLKPNNTYYLRSFVSNGQSKIYSSVISQKTPETSVASLSDVRFSADAQYLEATIEDDGGREITEVGFVWGSVNDRKSLRREKRYVATEQEGKVFRIPLSTLGEDGTLFVLAYAEDDKDATGFSRIPFERFINTPMTMSIEDVFNQRDGQLVIIEGAVAYAVSNQSMVIGDQNGQNFIYASNGSVQEYELRKGSMMTIRGMKITNNGMAQITNFRPENVSEAPSNLKEPEYKAYSSLKGKTFNRVQPILLNGITFMNEADMGSNCATLPMGSIQDMSTISFPFVKQPDPSWEFMSESTANSIKGFWLYRTDDETHSGLKLDNIIVGELVESSESFTWTSISEVLSGTDGNYYLISCNVSQITNTEAGSLLLKEGVQGQTADVTLTVPSLVNMYGESPKDAPGGWSSFGIAEEGYITVLGKRVTNGNTVELQNAILIKAN